MKYRLVIFDMDGTVLDTLEDIAACLNYALGECGFPPRSISEVRGFVGNGIRMLIERGASPYATQSNIDRLYELFKERYATHSCDKTKPYDGIAEVITQLRASGCMTAIVSNKADFAVQKLCKRYFDGLFDIAVGEREGISRKPEPDSVNMVMAELSVSAADCVYIGDSDVDIETAKNAGIDCVSVTWGFRERDFLIASGAKMIAEKPSELPAMLS